MRMGECILSGKKWHRYIIIDLKIIDSDAELTYTMSAYTEDEMKKEKKFPLCTASSMISSNEITHEKEDAIISRLFVLIRKRITKLNDTP